MLEPGSKVGPYTVEREIGRGGMGVVYLASDSRLGRKVAIKALPAEVSKDAARAARFEREARLLAGISHPNIAVVFGLEESDGSRFLVLEYLEGVTLAERMSRGALELRTALGLAAQIAAAVDAAHQAGVIHRDLKPGNVMVTTSGAVKVLDFGLAKEDVAPGAMGTTGPTATLPTPAAHTNPGVAMGTPGYLSPEQARGEPVDKRTDVFAFGCILFEMLSGKRAFPGQSTGAAIGALLYVDPDWAALPDQTPGAVIRLLKRCLAKDRDRRQRDMADARLELEDILGEPGAGVDDAGRQSKGASRVWSPNSPGGLKRFAVALPGDRAQPDAMNLSIALAPDGRSLAYAAQDDKGWGIWVRHLDRLEARRLTGVGSAWCLFYSPDSQWLAYCAGGELKKRRIEGGPTLSVCTSRGVAGAWWGDEGNMYITPYWAKGVGKVSERGGEFAFVTELDSATETSHLYPCLVPGTDLLLYTALAKSGRTRARIDALRLSTGRRHTVIDPGTAPKVASTARGMFLLWANQGTILAAPFDSATGTVGGPERPVTDGILNDDGSLYADFGVAHDGTLAFVPGPVYEDKGMLRWVEKDGSSTPFTEEKRVYAGPSFSRDGRRMCISSPSGPSMQVFWHDADHGVFNQLTFDSDNPSAAISPEGDRIVYCGNAGGDYELYLHQLDTGLTKSLGRCEHAMWLSWSPDGRHVLSSQRTGPRLNRELWFIDVEGPRVPRRLFASDRVHSSPHVSPNGKWIAYGSEETETLQVYVRSFPGAEGKRQISTDGGASPRWSRDGKTLYYVRRDTILGVPMSPEDGRPMGKPVVVTERSAGLGLGNSGLDYYAVAPDGRLLVVEPVEERPRVSHIEVIVNWFEALR